MTSMNQWKNVMKSVEDFQYLLLEVFMASQLLRIWWRWGVANMEGKMGFQTGNNGSSKEKDSLLYMDD
jgi:hypothetical protein